MAHTEGNCSGQVWDGWHHQPCSRRGSIERDGKLYCKQHDPEAIKARRDKTLQKWQAERDENAEKIRRQRACLNACNGIETADIEKLNAQGILNALRAVRQYFDTDAEGIHPEGLCQQVHAALAPFEEKGGER